MKNSKQNKRSSSAIAEAITKAEKHFREFGELPSFSVVQNPASEKSKVTSRPDCEDGMYQIRFRTK